MEGRLCWVQPPPPPPVQCLYSMGLTCPLFCLEGNPNSVMSPASSSQSEEQQYLEKLKQLSKYIEPLRRMINKIDKNEGKCVSSPPRWCAWGCRYPALIAFPLAAGGTKRLSPRSGLGSPDQPCYFLLAAGLPVNIALSCAK